MISNLPPKLVSLDASDNKLFTFTKIGIPTTLETLDITNNLIQKQDLIDIYSCYKHLKTFSCDINTQNNSEIDEFGMREFFDKQKPQPKKNINYCVRHAKKITI